jgi:spermidine/putrescine ABC transporter ATP-binding subunit
VGDLIAANRRGVLASTATSVAVDAARIDVIGARVSLRDMVHRYGENLAVDHVSLEIQPGEFMTLLGPSGSGKTTTLKMIAGFEAPDSGAIVVDDREITLVPPHDRNIGMVFQNYALFPHMSVRDNIAFPLKMRRWTRERTSHAVADALSLVHLTGYEDRFPRQLSGGQQQRVALARAIVFRPPLLLMDEPLGALDKQLRTQVQNEIKRIQEELGVTVVYVTHDQEEALFLSDRIALMNQGRIEQLGRPSVLYDEPASRFVAQFLGETNFIPGRVGTTNGRAVDVEWPGGVVVRGLSAQALTVGEDVEVAVRPEKLRLDSAAPDENSAVATVVRVQFVGEFLRLDVEPSPGVEMTVKLLSRSGQALLRPGDRIHLAWSQDDTRVFPA